MAKIGKTRTYSRRKIQNKALDELDIKGLVCPAQSDLSDSCSVPQDCFAESMLSEEEQAFLANNTAIFNTSLQQWMTLKQREERYGDETWCSAFNSIFDAIYSAVLVWHPDWNSDQLCFL